MSRKTNRYRSAAERARLAQNRPASPARFGPLGRLGAASRRRVRRPHPRRELVIVGSLALAVIFGIASLGAGYLLFRSDRDWTAVATVNGHDVSREALRARMAVLGLLASERASLDAGAAMAGYLTSDQGTALENAAAADTSLEAARQSLIDDELLAQLAARDGVETPTPPDPWVEATAYAAKDVAHQIRFVRFGLPDATSNSSPGASDWPAAAAANTGAATTRVHDELAAGTAIETIVSHLHDAGWVVYGEDVAVSADGVAADTTLTLDPAIAAGAVSGKTGDIAGPSTDSSGRVSLARVLDPAVTLVVSGRLSNDAAKAKVDTGALTTWAAGVALRRAVTAHLREGWAGGVTQAHFRELVIGAAPDSTGVAGPWVEISGLAVSRLAGVSAASIAGAPANLDLGANGLAGTLKTMAATDRAALFGSLVAAANRAGNGSTNASAISGDLGFYTKDGLSPDVGKAAFDAAVRAGDVIGPITTSAGPELFLIAARYSGNLDDRAKAALGTVRADPSPDPVAYTKKYSPTDAALALDAGWRASAEFVTTEPVHGALFDTPIGTLSDPFVLDGKLALAIVTERKTGPPDAATLDRLSLDGYDVWFASELARATVTRSDHPLPELEPSASPTASPGASPTASAAALPSLPELDTPNLPVIPGQPVATPVRTDAMGLPALP